MKIWVQRGGTRKPKGERKNGKTDEKGGQPKGGRGRGVKKGVAGLSLVKG